MPREVTSSCSRRPKPPFNPFRWPIAGASFLAPNTLHHLWNCSSKTLGTSRSPATASWRNSSLTLRMQWNGRIVENSAEVTMAASSKAGLQGSEARPIVWSEPLHLRLFGRGCASMRFFAQILRASKVQSLRELLSHAAWPRPAWSRAGGRFRHCA